MAKDDQETLEERNESLWWLGLPPVIWLVYFVVTYTVAAIYCAKAGGDDASLTPIRWFMGALGLVAFSGVAAVGIRGYRRHSYGQATAPHDFDTPEDRHRFLGFATLLLSGLSALGVIYVALPAIFVQTCR